MRPPAGMLVALTAILAAATVAADDIEEFVRRHWRAPLAPQGPPPARFSAVEASLQPESCGSRHPAQYADWRTSGHAAAMGPGVRGQLVEMLAADPGQALGCYGCHAPLAEQAPLRRDGGRLAPNPVFDASLRDRGLVCAGCHVRAHERFGPPRRDGTLESAAPRSTLPHNGVTRTPAFLRSEFCRDCHQFGADGFALSGTLLQDTYNEWRASRFAREGVQCQDCHMPDRRHLWRGIHDPDMVRSGITVEVSPAALRARPGEAIAVTLRMRSARVGHALPTYVTPRLVMRAELLDPAGEPLPDSREERVIGREVAVDLSHEVADTRLRPGETATLVYRRQIARPGLAVRLSIVVEPDAFYTRFFETLLAQGAGRGEGDIRAALEATRRSPFSVFERVLPVTER